MDAKEKYRKLIEVDLPGIFNEPAGKALMDDFGKGFLSGLEKTGEVALTIAKRVGKSIFDEMRRQGAQKVGPGILDDASGVAGVLSRPDLPFLGSAAFPGRDVIGQMQKTIEQIRSLSDIVAETATDAELAGLKEAREQVETGLKLLAAARFEGPDFSVEEISRYAEILGIIVKNVEKIKGILGAQQGRGAAGAPGTGGAFAGIAKSLGITDADLKPKTPFEKRLAQIHAETRALFMSDQAKERSLALESLIVQAKEKKYPLTEDEIRQFEREFMILQKVRGQREVQREVDERTDNYEIQVEALRKTNDEMERYAQLQQMVAEFGRRGIPVSEATVEQLDRQLETLQKMTRLREMFNSIGEAAGRAFDDIITGARSAKEALLDLLQEITRLIVHEIVTRKIVNFITGALSGLLSPTTQGPPIPATAIDPTTLQPVPVNSLAMGGAFNVVEAANGIIDRLSYIPRARGGYVKAGESGPEAAIAPLARDHSGRLGIEMFGGGGRGVDNRKYEVAVYVTGVQGTEDGLGRAASQVADQVRRTLMGR